MVGSDLHQRVFDALCTHSMDELARTAFEILEMPVVVTDAAFIVRAKYPQSELGDEQWDANVMNRQIEPRFVKTFTDDDHFTRHDQAEGAILTDWGHYASVPRLTQVMKAKGSVIGYFAALATGVEICECHYEACEVISNAFTILMEADAATRITRAEISSPTLYTLLEGGVDPSEIDAFLPEGFLDEHRGPYELFCIKPRNPHNAPLEAYLGDALARCFEHAMRTIFDGCLYILACGVSDDARGSVRADMFSSELERQQLACGASRVFARVNEMQLHRWEASSALRVGALVDSGSTLHHYDDLITYIALDALVANVPQGALEHEALEAVKRHDAMNRTDYFRTLKEYLKTGFDKKRTCEALHIHRNTLQYRLDRIREIQSLSLDDPYLSLYFSVEDYLERSGAHAPGERGARKPRAKGERA